MAEAEMDASDGYVAPPRDGPSPFASVDENVIESQVVPYNLDPSLTFHLKELPKGSSVLEVTPHGSSFWTQTAKLVAQFPDGSLKSYFLKVSIYPHVQFQRLIGMIGCVRRKG
jgi:protein-ribulosamine 3-kinase